MIPLDSDLMRGFLAVADTGSMTRAAERLERTQSAVSMQLRRLEEALGQPLFRRRPRGVELTARGAQLVPYARRIVGLLDEAATALRETPLEGPVRIGIPEEYSHTVLPRALAAFADRHPAVEVSVRGGYSAPLLAGLAADELDLAVVFEWSRPSDGEVLCVDPAVWMTSVANAQHKHRPLPVAVHVRSDWSRDFALRALQQQGIDHRIAFECDSTSALRLAVRSGLAVVAIPRSTIPAGCRELTAEDGFGLVDTSCVVMRRNPRNNSAAIEGLAAMLREAFRPLVTRDAAG